MINHIKRAALIATLLTGSAFAHHSFTAEFDPSKPIKLSGKITEMKWSNPHGWIYVDVTGPDGKVVNWALETGGANALYRRGWKRKICLSVRSSSLKDGKRETARRQQTSISSPSKMAAACLPAHPTATLLNS